MKLFTIFILALSISHSSSHIANASEDAVDTAIFKDSNYIDSTSTQFDASDLGGGTGSKFLKKKQILEKFNAPIEKAYPEYIDPYNGTQTLIGYQQLKKYFDPKLEFNRYFEADEFGVRLFLDRDEKQNIDTSINFSKQNESTENDFVNIQGLRVAIDPGHMGGNFWDHETGKFVEISGQRVSEGELNLITSLLVSRELEALGAKTMITHDLLRPVSELDYKSFQLDPFARDQFLKESDAPWFENIIGSSDDLPTLFNLFSNHTNTKKIFSEISRNTYFILKADLQARADKINQFNPDVTLVIHYDASVSNRLQTSAQGVKIYVPGGILESELPSRKYRYQYFAHLLNTKRWLNSVDLSQQIANSIAVGMGIPLEKNPDISREFYVRDGVFARNLNLNRENLTGIIAYLECMHYDYASEFKRLIVKDRKIQIGNEEIAYSSRIETMASSIVKGIQSFVSSKTQRPVSTKIAKTGLN